MADSEGSRRHLVAEGSSDVEDINRVMAEKAHEMFSLCDLEGKGRTSCVLLYVYLFSRVVPITHSKILEQAPALKPSIFKKSR